MSRYLGEDEQNHAIVAILSSMGSNTVIKHIQRLRKWLNLAFKLSRIGRDFFVNFKAQFSKTEISFCKAQSLGIHNTKRPQWDGGGFCD